MAKITLTITVTDKYLLKHLEDHDFNVDLKKFTKLVGTPKIQKAIAEDMRACWDMTMSENGADTLAEILEKCLVEVEEDDDY
jgi:hypothetical protein